MTLVLNMGLPFRVCRTSLVVYLLVLATCCLFARPSPSLQPDPSSSADLVPDYLIIGAGGGGLQLGLFLQKYNYSYAILEREDVVGSFWTRFPVFGELISVNKGTRDERERLRYDWHSMLEAPLTMREVTEDYFPKGIDWHRYMTRVADMAGLNVEHGVEVERVVDGKPCVITADRIERCARRRIFVATGLREKSEPLLRAMGGTPYSRMTKEMAKQRRVCILGNGNSGFEVAENTFDVADRVILYGKHPHRLSSVTRYTGDVRVKYLQVLENLNGKLLDTVDSFADIRPPQTQGLETILNASQLSIVHGALRIAAWLDDFACEAFVITTGFESHVPGGLTLNSTFPPTTDWYQSAENPFVHYIGWLMHEPDFRRGAGGFLSGYRYLIRNLVHHIREEDDGEAYPYDVLTRDQVVDRIVSRCQFADDLIILQDGVVLRDVAVPVLGGGEKNQNAYRYYQGITHEFHQDIAKQDGAIALYFAWGDGRARTSAHVFNAIHRFTDTKKLINLFLHPVVQVGGGLVRAIHEDLEMAWASPPYVSAIEMTVRAALEGNLERFSPEISNPYVEPTFNQTGYGEEDYFEAAKLTTGIIDPVVQALWKAVYTNHHPLQMQDVQDAMKAWMPSLFDHREQDSSMAGTPLPRK